MDNKNKEINTGKSRVILDFSIAKQKNLFGIVIGSRINMPILEKNFKEAFKREEVKETFNDICSNAMKILDFEKNNINIVNEVKGRNLPILSLNMMQLESLDSNQGYKIIPFFDINHDNIKKISSEETCKEFKRYLENNKENFQDGANIVIDAVMKSIAEYQKQKSN